ncbi:ATP-binding protein [Streptomyces sp. NPDC058045]|uniref:ATP-binding protein n=1 Tax=Streptomyces sp. NPDC058045 TaxID=3346311 RepID=UPI0036EB03D3
MRRSPRPGPAQPAPSPSVRRRGNLPVELDAFIGRRGELTAVAGHLKSARLVTVTGPGGVGKSRLAIRAAARTRPRDGVWHIDLAEVLDPGLVPYALVEALELTDSMTREPRPVLLEQLAGRRLLLVLDGFEHLAAACAPLVAELLRAAPGLRVLAAGRRPLGVAGEVLLPMAPLPADEAAELLARRAAAAGAEVDPAADEVAELCRRLDGMPLAVELAAGKLGALAPEQLLERLDEGLGLLSGGGGALPRHRAVRTAIGWSHELCTPEERLLWSRLSVFRGSFDLEAAEYVCGGEGLAGERVLEVLESLLAQSVVQRAEPEPGVPGARYRMLGAVRAYGGRWLAAAGDAERLGHRHRDWYLGFAAWSELEWFSPRQARVAAATGAELPNLRAALEWCLSEPGQEQVGQLLAGSLWFHWVGCGRLAEGRHWLERSVAADAGTGPASDARLKALWVLGYVAVLQGDPAVALRALRECGSEAERSGNRRAAAYAVHRTGCLALVGDDLPAAERLLREALERYRAVGELNSNVLMGQVELALAVAFQGDLAGAADLCREVREACEDHGERWALAYALFVLGYAAWAEGATGRARQLLSECLAISHSFHDLLGTVLAVELLALLAVADGGAEGAEEAAVLQGAAASIWPRVGLPLFGSRTFGAPHQRCETLARRALGDARYTEGVRAGRLLDTRAAVERALGGGAPRAGAAPAACPPPRQAPDVRKPAASPAASGEATG